MPGLHHKGAEEWVLLDFGLLCITVGGFGVSGVKKGFQGVHRTTMLCKGNCVT